MAAANNVIDIGHRGPKRLPSLEAKRRALLGELVVATGAGDLALDALAGLLLSAADTACVETVRSWELRGAAFFNEEAQSAL